MKLLVAIASTLFVVLVSQQFASAMPLDGSISFFTDMPLTERDMSDFSGMTTEKSTTEIKREVEEPLIDEATTVQVEEPVDETETKVKRTAEEFIENATTEKTKRAKAVKVIEKEELTEATEETPKKVKVTVEDKLEEVKEESTKETPKKVKVTVEDEKVEKVKEEEEHKEAEESTKEIPKKVKVTVEDEKVEKVKEEEHKEVEESTKEIAKKPKVAVEEEKPKKFKDEKSEESKEEKTKESDFCPEGYAKFEDSCLHVGTKGKVSARSGKMSSSTPVNNLVENIPVGDDNSCPPGTEHTERGVCQKILTPEELKLKKVVDQGCPENSRLVDGRCTFHSFELTTSSMKLPLETSERMEVEPEIRREEYSTAAPEHEVIVESEFETTMQTVLKA